MSILTIWVPHSKANKYHGRSQHCCWKWTKAILINNWYFFLETSTALSKEQVQWISVSITVVQTLFLKNPIATSGYVVKLEAASLLKRQTLIHYLLTNFFSPSWFLVDCQSLSSKRRRDNTSNQDKSMDWFTSNEEWNALNKETDAVLCRTICVALQGHRWLLKHFPLNSK